MAKVTPHIGKSKLPRTHQHVLRYSDIESVVLEAADRDFYLDVWFASSQDWDKRERDRLLQEGRFYLLDLEHNPEAPSVRRPLPFYPWCGVEHPVVIRARIRAVPRTVVAETGLNRGILRAVAAEQTALIARHGLFENRWDLHVVLAAQERLMEGTARTWTGIREAPERRFRRALAPPE